MKSLLGSLALACTLLFQPPMARALPADQGDATAGLAGEVAYDEQNPFARIIRGELPAYKVYEDAQKQGSEYVSRYAIVSTAGRPDRTPTACDVRERPGSP